VTWCKTQNYTSSNPYLLRKGVFQKQFLSIQGVDVKKFYDGARGFLPEEGENVMLEAQDSHLKGPISSFLTYFTQDDHSGMNIILVQLTYK